MGSPCEASESAPLPVLVAVAVWQALTQQHTEQYVRKLAALQLAPAALEPSWQAAALTRL